METNDPISSLTHLRRKADAILARAPSNQAEARPADELLHELQVHQIELEMQNETLRQTRLALEESRDRYLDLYEFAPVGYLTLTDAGLIVDINLTGATLLGAERGTLLDRRFARLVAAGDGERWRRFFLSVLNYDEGQRCELALQRGDGSRLHVRLDGRRSAVAGNALRARITLTDISERVDAETESRQMASEVMDLYQNAPCGYHSVDAEGRIVRINDTELEWLGYAREELLGRRLTDILTPACQGLFAASFPLLQQGLPVRDLEHDMIRKDGSILPVLLNATAIFDSGHRFVMSRATLADMTEQKKLSAERLEQEAHRATLSRHLIDVQEEERRRLAQELHDVVTPNLAAVQINLRMLESDLSLAAARKLAPRLNDARQLIRDTNGSLRDICANLRSSVLDYAGLYAAVDNYARRFAMRTRLIVELTGGETDGRLPADVETSLFRIVQEAMTNCARHAGAARISIELSHDREHAYLEISDDGKGFDPEELAAPERMPGLGLLTMAERAESAGGSFRLASRPGQGTRITVEI